MAVTKGKVKWVQVGTAYTPDHTAKFQIEAKGGTLEILVAGLGNGEFLPFLTTAIAGDLVLEVHHDAVDAVADVSGIVTGMALKAT